MPFLRQLSLLSLATVIALSGCSSSHRIRTSSSAPNTSNKTAKRIFSALPDYARLARMQWPQIHVSAMPLKVGSQDASVPEIRKRLVALGDMQSGAVESQSDYYNSNVSMGVARFQWRHGLKPDGVLGEKTLSALNVTPARRLAQLEKSMARWAEFPEDEGSHYIRVNAANYRLDIVKDGNKVMDMRVVVGRPSRQTPEVYSKVETVVFNPKWNVPLSIARKDVIPKILKDPNYLEDNAIEVFSGWGKDAKRIDPNSIDWQKYRNGGFPYRFTQMPGDDNALGRVKFLFKNQHDVYLHDTPHRELFDEVARAYSSGCIRVEQPYKLVEYFIKDNENLDHEALSRVISSKEMKYIKIKNPVPIYITYITAWVDKQGKAHFREDLYKRDNI